MWDVKACRSCLTVKGKLEKIGDASKRQYASITGLQISEGDGYPAYFCVECRHHIRKSLAFRRKNRRAHFVLKEIMNVRKQVTYSDIITVNRKKTNLESSLNFWQPSNNSCYLLASEEGGIQADYLKKYSLDLVQYTRNNSKHIVDIKPEIVAEVPKEEPKEIAEPEQPEVEATNDDVDDIADIPTNDYLEPDQDTANIDMNDIFKDLNEPEPESDDEIEQLQKKEVKPVDVMNNAFSRRTFSVSTITKAMMAFDVKVLSLDEQKKKMQTQLNLVPFARAMYKCSMCLTVHKSLQELVEHVEYHNERKFDQECQVCKNKFPTVKDLNIHVSISHLYDYKCKICSVKVYSLKDAVHHLRYKHNSERNSDLFTSAIESRKKLREALSIFTITPLSQQMMNDVMLLRSRPDNSKTKETGVAKPGDPCVYTCDICKVGFKFRSALEKHMVLKHRYVYTCKLCKEVLTTRAQAIEHSEQTHSYNISCQECGKTFMNSKRRNVHVKLKHVKYIACNLCGHAAKSETFYYKHQLREHGYISLNDPLVGDPQHKCSECQVQFVDRRSLERHLVSMNHSGANMVQYACVPCKRVYDTEEELETHFITCRDARQYPRKCCYCSEMLHNHLEYKTHFIYAHPDLPYRYVSQNSICDICGKSIFKPMLEAHRRAHSGSGSGLQCRLCAAPARGAPAALVAHMLGQHARRPFRCALCPRRFKYRSDCKDHILKVHAPTKLYKCEFCGVEFSYWKNLKEHSESVHNLVIPPIKNNSLKSKQKIFVYAHMKIIINELERDLVKQSQVELIDYLEQKSKPVEYENYFIFSPDAEETALCMRKRKRGKKNKKKLTELESAVAEIIPDNAESRIKIEKIEIIKPFETDQNQYVEHSGSFKQIDEENTVIEDMDVDNSAVLEVLENEGHEYVMVNEDGENTERFEKEDKADMEGNDIEGNDIEGNDIEGNDIEGNDMEDSVDTSTPLEVIENGGHQYVMINGEMYRIACEDEV